MEIKKVYFSDDKDLKRHVLSRAPTLFTSSQTSTVIPYDLLKEHLTVNQGLVLGSLAKLAGHLELTAENSLVVKGAVSWKEAKEFLGVRGRILKTSPTEELALVNAGLATSATGERCFGFGNLRGQVQRLKYLDFNGEIQELSRERPLGGLLKLNQKKLLENYQKSFAPYKNFKNAPYPRFEVETDLMIGTEGQLGVITESVIETAPATPLSYIFILLPRWEVDFEPHLEIYRAVQKWRGPIISCEFADSHSMAYLKSDEKLGDKQDVLFLEIQSEYFDQVYSNLMENLTLINENQIFEIGESKYQHIRKAIPRSIFEENSRKQVEKAGTDAQVRGENFKELLLFYRRGKELGIETNLFGHFGDAHLHFNFMPKPGQRKSCDPYFVELYQKVQHWQGSPFAEHGIGFSKLKFIRPFYSSVQLEFFKELKQQFDPHQQFFPYGFMNYV